MSMQLQSTSTVLPVSLEKTELLSAIKNEPPESEIGIEDIPNSLDKEIIPDLKDIDIVSYVLSEDLIKSETVSENTFENNHSGSVETKVFIKTENIPLIQTENITQSEYFYKTQDTSDGNVSRGTSQGVTEVQGSNEHFSASQSDKQFVNFFQDLSDSRQAKCPNKTDFSKCYKTVESTSCEKDEKKRKVIEVPVIPIEPHKYTSLAKAKHACNKNKSTHKQNKKRYCCEKCMYMSERYSDFKKHQLTHKTKAEIDDRVLKYRCNKCKYKTYWNNCFKVHKLTHLKPEEIHYFYCYHCSYKSKQKVNLQIHIFRHFKNEDVPFHCYICDFMTQKRNLIIEHFKKHPKHHSKCDETDYKNQFETYFMRTHRTYHYERLKLRELTHKTEAELDDRFLKYRCDKCKYKTFRSDVFKVHKLTHLKPEEIQYFYCYQCSYKSNRKQHLKVHELSHKTEAEMDGRHFKYRCDKCKYKTFRPETFKRHKLIHLKPEEIQYFYCYHCSYKSNRKQNLKVHIFRHFKKEEIPFNCYICDFVTLKAESFKKHLNYHNK